MNHRIDHPEDQFDIWLDAYVAGRSTPASRAASDSVPGDVRAAARQFHGLAHGSERSPTLPPLAPTWEDFMSTNAAAAAPAIHPETRRVAALSPPVHRDSSVKSNLPYRGAHWHVALNVALALLLIAVIGGGVWRATGGFGSNGADWQSAFAPDTRVWTPEALEATPGSDAERALLPTAEECTVEPLTVDDVLWYIEDPIAATMSRDIEQATTPDVSLEPTEAAANVWIADATPAVTDSMPFPTESSEIVRIEDTWPAASPLPTFTPGPASPEQLAAIAEVQREWMACVLADSPFQRWALESPALVAEQVMPLFPSFPSREDARQILEAVEATGEMWPSDDFWRQPNASYRMITSQGFPTLDTIVLIDPTTAGSWTLDGRTITVAYTSHHSLPDGEVIVTQGELTVMGTPIAESDTFQPGVISCNSFDFTWFPDRGQLLVSSIPTCG